jgi:hypothetical protein
LFEGKFAGGVENSVLTVTNAELVALGLKVDVRRTGLQRIHKDVIDNANRDGHIVATHFARLPTFPNNQSKSFGGTKV